MKVLLDHCVPKQFRGLLTGHEAVTARAAGFDSLVNGRLLAAAKSAGFDATVTVDQNMRFEQNLRKSEMSVVVMIAKNNRIATLRPFQPWVLAALEGLVPGTLVLIDDKGSTRVIRD